MLNYDVKRRLVVLSENKKTHWTKELTKISWNGAPVKYDIRDWSPDHLKLSKGITLTEDEMKKVKEAILRGLF